MITVWTGSCQLRHDNNLLKSHTDFGPGKVHACVPLINAIRMFVTRLNSGSGYVWLSPGTSWWWLSFTSLWLTDSKARLYLDLARACLKLGVAHSSGPLTGIRPGAAQSIIALDSELEWNYQNNADTCINVFYVAGEAYKVLCNMWPKILSESVFNIFSA